MEFEPTVIALEPVVIWRDRDKDQVQVFIDQAMRVPKLLVGIELGGTGQQDSAGEFHRFQMQPVIAAIWRRSRVKRQPDDDPAHFDTRTVNLPSERGDRIRVPLLFEYRGEIVPSPRSGNHALAPDHSGESRSSSDRDHLPNGDPNSSRRNSYNQSYCDRVCGV
jgi:hypothetical protein